MAFPDEASSSEQLLNAHGHVWNQIFNFINSMSLKCAIQLGLFDIVHKHGKPITLTELFHALPINKHKSHGVDRLMRILTLSKFFVKVSIPDKEEKEGYWLTPASRLLFKDDPSSVASFALAMLDPLLIDPWHHVGEWFQNDTPTPFASAHGKAFWELVGHEPRITRFFNEGMTSDAHFVATIITSDCKHVFEGLKSIVDVGGGTGTVAKVIGDAFPGLKCFVLDLPHVVAGLEGTDNLTFVGGDMFDFVPPAEAVFLKWILHGWSDEQCIKVLMKCKEAIPKKENGGGKVIIADIVVTEDEMMIKDHEATETQFFFDMLMMTVVTGKERKETQWREIFLAAGFTSYKITPCLGVRSLIEIFP